MNFNLEIANSFASDATAQQIIGYVAEQSQPSLLTTSFGENSAVMLSLVKSAAPNMPIIWIDHGFNMPHTLEIQQTLIQQLGLDITIYRPKMSKQQILDYFGGEIPGVDDEQHAEFTQLVKLEPMQKVLEDIRPYFWLSGVRANESAQRAKMQVFTEDSKREVIKVAPILSWSDEQVESYMQEHNLPSPKDYFDPTKVEYGRECGLHI